MNRTWPLALAFTIVTLSACAGPSSGQIGSQPVEQGARAPTRTLTMGFRYEPGVLAPKFATTAGGPTAQRPLNAFLVVDDADGVHRPYLAAELPRLNSDTWRVFPDGRMETTYILRPGLTWHDGHSLTADDFVFAWRVYTAPGLDVFSPQPQNLFDEVAAPDPQTVVIRWRRLNPDADALTQGTLDPLPRHILEAPFSSLEQSSGSKEAFLNQAYWTDEFVGAGPYRLVRWDRGLSIETVAFDGHALGRPRIDRFIERFFGDENAALTAILSEEIQNTASLALRFEHAVVLKREWASSGRGIAVFISPIGGGAIMDAFQFRPEMLKTPALMDLRVRQAFAHTVDRQALQDGLFDGEGAPAFTRTDVDAPYAAELDRVKAKYPYEPRRAEQLMSEAGFVRGPEGLFVDPSGQRFNPNFVVHAGSVFERAQQILVEIWKQAGFGIDPSVRPAVLAQDFPTLASFSGMASFPKGGGERAVLSVLASEQMGTPANQYRGFNSQGWTNPEYDRLWDAYNTTLDRSERDRQVVQMMKIESEILPVFPLYRNPSVTAHLATLTGLDAKSGDSNMHEWELR